MRASDKLALDTYLGTMGINIDSSLVSFQKRERVYWSNGSFSPPQDTNVSFQDFIERSADQLYKLKRTPSRDRMWCNGVGRNNGAGCANVTHAEKIYCLTTKQDRCPNSGLVEYEDFCRYLTRRELELAQTVPVGYTDCLSYNQACKVLGNGWTVDVIVHILKQILEVNQ